MIIDCDESILIIAVESDEQLFQENTVIIINKMTKTITMGNPRVFISFIFRIFYTIMNTHNCRMQKIHFRLMIGDG
jgi:ABC-type tungstate transport system permease subunit